MKRKRCPLGVRVACLASTVVFVARPASASGTEEHRALMIAAQLMLTDGKLLRAKELFWECERQECATSADAECGAIRDFCRQKHVELAAEIPSVRVAVLDERGDALTKATRRIGSTLVEADTFVLLDPGRHVLRVDYAGRSVVLDFQTQRGGLPQTLTAMLDLRRTVVDRPTPWPVWVLGAAAGAGALGFGVGAWATRAQVGSFDDCRPTCELSKRSGLETATTAADISLAVGVVAGLGAAIVYLVRPRVERVEHFDPVSSLGGPR